jgi:hypothetical protein
LNRLFACHYLRTFACLDENKKGDYFQIKLSNSFGSRLEEGEEGEECTVQSRQLTPDSGDR